MTTDFSNITFTPLAEHHLALLHDWLTRPHVAEWWGSPPASHAMRTEFASPLLGAGPERGYIANIGNVHLGFIQSYTPADSHDEGWWLEENDPGVRGIDQFIADEAMLGRGYGTEMVRSFVALLFRDPSVRRVQTDPDPRNARAIRAYEKAGFRVEREVATPDGAALLMYRDRA